MKKSLGAKVLAFPTPVWIVGSYGEDDRPNIMCAAWAGVCCSKPPCVYISLRKATLTYGNIMTRKAFTVSIPSQKFVREADHVGIVSGRDEDKFKKLGLTPIRSDIVDAPYPSEFEVVLECKLLHTLEIGLHTEFVGEIMDVKADENLLDEKGRISMERFKPFVWDTGDSSYRAIGEKIGNGFEDGKTVK